MLSERQKQILRARENSRFMHRLYSLFDRDLLTEEERFILCRDCFRFSVLNLTVLSLTLPLGMILEGMLFSVLPTLVFASKWRAYIQAARQQAVRQATGSEPERTH